MNAIHATLEPLHWENAFFSVNSSLVRISDGAPPLTKAQLTCWSRIQAKIPAQRTDWLDGLQELGFQFVEGEVDLRLRIKPSQHRIRFDIAQSDDIAVLRDQAAHAFRQSRFRSPWYQADDSHRFYAQWVENAVHGTFDNQCLLLKEAGVIRGFVTLRQLDNQQARIGLLAGKGLGSALMDVAQYWCQQRGLEMLRVATQVSNQAALRLYIQRGATIDSTAFWLYR